MGFAYLGVALTAASILLLEIALTRVFAIMMWRTTSPTWWKHKREKLGFRHAR